MDAKGEAVRTFREEPLHSMVRGEFKCYYCDRPFDTHNAVKMHEDTKHADESEGRTPRRYCNVDPDCKKPFRNETCRAQHVTAAHPEAIEDYKLAIGIHSQHCTLCNKDFEELAAYVQHTEAHKLGFVKSKAAKSSKHPKSEGHDDPAVPSAPAKSDPGGSSEDGGKWSCDLCTKKRHFTKLIGLNDHLRKVHKIEVHGFPCKHCSTRFDTKRQLTDHYRAGCSAKAAAGGGAGGEEPRVCPECQIAFPTMEKYTRHWHATHNPHIFRCRLCLKPFEVDAQCVQHENSHTPEDPAKFVFACSTHLCTQLFENPADLFNHQVALHGLQTEERMCPHCGHKFHKDFIIVHQPRCKRGQRTSFERTPRSDHSAKRPRDLETPSRSSNSHMGAGTLSDRAPSRDPSVSPKRHRLSPESQGTNGSTSGSVKVEPCVAQPPFPPRVSTAPVPETPRHQSWKQETNQIDPNPSPPRHNVPTNDVITDRQLSPYSDHQRHVAIDHESARLLAATGLSYRILPPETALPDTTRVKSEPLEHR